MASRVPAVPSLQNIKDPETRRVLQALIDGWNVRNGQTRDDGARFVTRSELEDLTGGTTIFAGRGSTSTGQGVGPNGLQGWNQGAMSAYVQYLIDQIKNSKLWKKLSSRIDRLDGPGGALERLSLTETGVASYIDQTDTKIEALEGQLVDVDGTIAAIVETRFTEVSAEFATAESVTDLQTTVGEVALNAQEALSISQGVDGSIEASWTVKFDVDGFVVGAGLGLEGKEGAYTSQFLVRADRFAVGSPSFDVFPFIVDVDPEGGAFLALNGQVYIGSTSLETIAENAAAPAVNFIGVYATAPSSVGLKANSVYRNTTDGNLYVLTIEGGPWVLWLEKGPPGDPGETGDSIDIIFRRATSQPSTPAASSGVPSGWYSNVASVPAFGGGWIWSSIGTKAAGSELYTWQTPLKIEGSDGASGLSIAEVTIFRRSASAPSTPTGGSYNFSTKVLSPPSGWSFSVPAGTDPVYTSRTTASSADSSATVSTGSWSTPVLSFQNGAQGAQGLDGPYGLRGTVDLVTTGSSWSDATANSAILSATGSSLRVTGDKVTITNGTTATTKYWSGVSWTTITAYIDGGLLVKGTVIADRLTVGTTSGGVAIGYANPGSTTPSNGIYIYQQLAGYYGLYVENKSTTGGCASFRSQNGSTIEVNLSGAGSGASGVLTAMSGSTYMAKLSHNQGGVGYSLWTNNRALIGGDLNVTGDITAANFSSDARLKEGVVDTVQDGIAFVNALRVVDFKWKPVSSNYDYGVVHTGFIAQEVQQVLPGAVKEESDTLYLYKWELVPYLTKAVQELHAEVESLKQQIASLQP